MGIDGENTIKIWQWRKGKALATVAGHSERVFDIRFVGARVVTCGVKHIRFWTLLGNTLELKEGEFGKSEIVTLLCIGTFGDSKNSTTTTDEGNQICFTGAINGDLIIWKKHKLDRVFSGIHSVSQSFHSKKENNRIRIRT